MISYLGESFMAHLENLYNILWVAHNNKVVNLNSKLLF